MSDNQAQSESEGRPERRSRRTTGRTPSTQLIVLGWCLWIVGSWGVALLSGSVVPAARWLLMLTLAGLMLAWPAVRLSLTDVRLRPWGVLGEWLCLALILQAVIWPLRLLLQWRLDQALWLTGALAAWSLLTAALVALGMRSRGDGPRLLAMAGCVALVIGEPVVMALAVTLFGVEAWALRANPLVALWALMQPAVNVTLDPWPQHVWTAGAAALGAWVIVAVTRSPARGTS